MTRRTVTTTAAAVETPTTSRRHSRRPNSFSPSTRHRFQHGASPPPSLRNRARSPSTQAVRAPRRQSTQCAPPHRQITIATTAAAHAIAPSLRYCRRHTAPSWRDRVSRAAKPTLRVDVPHRRPPDDGIDTATPPPRLSPPLGAPLHLPGVSRVPLRRSGGSRCPHDSAGGTIRQRADPCSAALNSTPRASLLLPPHPRVGLAMPHRFDHERWRWEARALPCLRRFAGVPRQRGRETREGRGRGLNRRRLGRSDWGPRPA